MSRLGHFQILVFLHALLLFSAESRKTQLVNDNDIESSNKGAKGKQWAVLLAGSNEYYNYRHQVCFFFFTLFEHLTSNYIWSKRDFV